MMLTDVRQRLRVTFGVQDPLIYASVLDLGRLWERLLRRARVPLAYTQGFNPHPRLQFAAALPVGHSSECEPLDILLAEAWEPARFGETIAPELPPGLSIRQVEDIALNAPSPQASMRLAHYRVGLVTPAPAEQVRAALDGLLARGQIIRQHPRKGEMREYDLRPLILTIALQAWEGERAELFMVLRCGPEGSGRPEEIVEELALQVSDVTIHRCRLIWGETQED